jgi:hypothetical protein
MAITINDTPATYASAHDDLWFVSSSTNSGTANFKYVYDVIINSVLVARSKVFPDPTGNYGVFNASPIVRTYLTNYFEPSGSSILVASNNKLKVTYTIQIGEEVGGVVTTNLANGTFSAYNFYPPLFADILAVKNNTPLVLSTYYDNLLIDNFSDDWLTERDTDEVVIEYGDNFYATYFRVTTGSYIAYCDVVDESGAVVSTYSNAITLSGEFNLFNLQAGHINSWAGSTLITDATYGYDFYLVLGAGQSRKIKLRQKCYPKYKQYNIHFLNRVGGWDTMKFALVNRRSSEFQRSTYRRNDWQLGTGVMSNVDSYNRYNETALNYAIQHKDKYNLKSDWVSEQDYTWLGQLVASSIAYIEVQGAYFPITISSNNYTYKIFNADKLFNFEIDIEVSKYINSQFR